MLTKHVIGTFKCPSGNVVDVYASRDGGVIMEWDEPPPLSPDDECYYRDVIMPAVMASISEHHLKDRRFLSA